MRLAHLLALAAAVTLGLWVNMSRQSTDYGTSFGRFADQVDSYSEYLIRNTVLNDLAGHENRNGSLIKTHGYEKNDYSYSPDGTYKYFSNRGIQVRPYEWLAGLSENEFLAHSDGYFQALRLLNCALLTSCALAFFASYFGKTAVAAIALVLFSFTTGAGYFASNLYFQSWILFSPLACCLLLTKGWRRAYALAAFVLSILYFSVRYEFATTFAMLWLLPVLLHSVRTGRLDRILLAGAFLASCAGFAIALLLHHAAVAHENGVSLSQASALIFSTLQMRVATLVDVPAPFSFDFFRLIGARWSMPAIVIPLVATFSKLAVFGVFALLAVRHRRDSWISILGWAMAAYVSWYVFAYQHMMTHWQYDFLMFTATIALSVLIVGLSELAGIAPAASEPRTIEVQSELARRA